jgi:hypothetical protein
MSAVVMPDEEDCYLLAILEAPDGLDLAEFTWYDPESEDGCYRAWDFQWCLAGDTVVVTSQGRRQIGDLAQQRPVQVLTVNENGQSVWVTAQFESFGRRRLWNITATRDGVTKVLRATNVHEWMASYERQAERRRFRRTTTQDLQPGAFLQVADAPEVPIKLDRVGVQRGVVWGDGTHVKNASGQPSSSRVNLWGAKRQLADWFDVDPREILNRPDVGVPGYYMSPLPANFKLSPVALDEPAAVRWGWLAGFFATDGSVAAEGGQCTLSSAQPEHLEHVRDIATSLGVGTSRVRQGGKGYILTLYASHLPVEFFIHPVHVRRSQSERPFRRTVCWRVTSVEPSEVIDEVFCTTIGGTHNFVLDDDLVTGNCWYTNNDMYQIDQGGRALGKTVGIKMRAFAFPFAYEGQRMLLTAPELNHLRPLTDEIEKALLSTRLLNEMLPDGKGKGIARQPHWQVRFKNNTGLVSRLPNKDGKGVKGCVGAGTLILTERGQIPVEEVQVGDQVLTHAGRWRKVGKTFRYGAAPVVTVAGAGHRGLVMSETHSMYARRNRNPQRARNLEEPVWLTPACEAAEGQPNRWYFGSPTVVPAITDVPDGVTPEMLYVAGCYVADGHLYSSAGVLRGVGITDDVDDMERLLASVAACGLPRRLHEKPSRAVRLDIEDRPFAHFIQDNFGELAHAKQLPTWLLSAPASHRLAFLDGYLSGDGHYNAKRERWEVSSASKALIIGLRLLGQSLGFVCSYSWVDPKVTSIKGVPLKNPPRRSHRLKLSGSDRNAVIDDGVAWQKVRSMTLGGEADTYDLYVEEDHSYIADGLISHNQHVINIELDEAQDYPAAGYAEIVETLNAGLPGAMWRCHGVSKGIRDKFFEKTQPNSGWVVHRPMAMHRPTWGKTERDNKIKEYGGSRQAIDYRRNIYGEHGDASAAVFVLAKLMACVDLDEGSLYNSEIYTNISMEFESFPDGAGDDERLALLHAWVDLPGTHKHGYSQKVNGREVGSPKGYTAYWGGMDVGVTNHPSELLVFGQRHGTDFLELITRIHMRRINTDDQMHVVSKVMDFYGPKLRLGIDKTGVGFPIWDQLTRRAYGARVYGFGFSEKRVAAIEDRELVGTETIKDLARYRNFVESSTDWLRSDYVDAKKLRLPYDREVLIEFQGQTYTTVKDTGDPYGTTRRFSGGSFHTLDAAKIAVATKHIPPLEEMLESRPAQESVLDVFVGM